MLSVEGLSKSYGAVAALDQVDLEVSPGEVVGLLGPNGAGKTTLVSIVAGLRRADSGTVRVGTIDALAHPQRARRLLGLAPQDLGIYPIITVRQNLRLFAELAGLSGAELITNIDRVAEVLHITPLLDRKAGTLSGGQKRRLHTGIALLNHPPLLLLDEATTGADVGTRSDLLQVVRDLAGEGSAILYSTHYLHEVETLDASVVILEEGGVIAEGSVRRLIAAHGTAATELTFDGPPPAIEMTPAAERDGNVLRIVMDEPAAGLAAVLAALGPEAARLRSVEIIEPSLETVYLTLTGHRYQRTAETDTAEEEAVAS